MAKTRGVKGQPIEPGAVAAAQDELAGEGERNTIPVLAKLFDATSLQIRLALEKNARKEEHRPGRSKET